MFFIVILLIAEGYALPALCAVVSLPSKSSRRVLDLTGLMATEAVCPVPLNTAVLCCVSDPAVILRSELQAVKEVL